METVITANGKIIQVGDGTAGLKIVDDDGIVMLLVGEVSDNETSNLFIEATYVTSGIVPRDKPDDENPNYQYEVLRNR